MRRKYNACYRLRKKGFSISSKSKTILPPPIFNINSEMKILLNEFHFVIQTKLFD